MYWSHFIHHSKAIHRVINPLAYLAAGDSTSRANVADWGTNTVGRARAHTLTFHVKTNTRAHTCRDTYADTRARVSLGRGRHGDPRVGKKEEKKNLGIQLEPKARSLTRATSRDRKIFLPASLPRKMSKKKKRKKKGQEEGRGRGAKKKKRGREKKNRIQLHSRNPLLALRE